MFKIIFYIVAEIIFFPSVIVLLLLTDFILVSNDTPLSFSEFFEAPVSWISLATISHLGVIIGNNIIRKKLSISDYQKLKQLQNIIMPINGDF